MRHAFLTASAFFLFVGSCGRCAKCEQLGKGFKPGVSSPIDSRHDAP